MAKSKSGSLIRGKRLRVTRLNGAGVPVIGADNAASTKGYVSVAYTTNIEEGEAITQPNANGETCITEPGTPSFNGFGAEALFCDVDFAVFEIMTGQPVVLNEDYDIVGITESTEISLADVNFALEVWTGASAKGTPSAGSQGTFGYILTPYLSGGVISDITVENAAINFTITGMATKNGSGWGAGPYAVELLGGVPAPLRTRMKANDHRRIQIVEVEPPMSYSGSIPVLDRSDAELTAVESLVSELSVSFTPTPEGQPVFYDLGDGTWDYSETGAYTHEYEEAGDYTVRATSGGATVTETVTVIA